MIVTANHIYKYRSMLKRISGAAGLELQQYMQEHKFQIDDEFLVFVEALTKKYGEAAGAVSAQFYDDLGEYWDHIEKGGKVGSYSYSGKKAADIADVPTGSEIRSLLRGKTAQQVVNEVQRLIKRTAEDTTLQNAIRDGAEFAWVPSGDSCPFCLMLAAKGWQKASKKALKGDHAEHIHANCDCNYVIRHDPNTTVEGYDPEALRAQFEAAEGATTQEKINSLRRANYAANKDAINAQKRAAYALREKRKVLRKNITIADFDYLKARVGESAKDSKFHVSGEIIDCIKDRLREKGAMDYYLDVLVEALDGNDLLQTYMQQMGERYICILKINGAMLDGRTLKDVQEYIKISKSTICETLEECVDHEIVHAKQAKNALMSVIDRLQETEGVASISVVASKDMLETLAEVSVLKDKGLYDKILLELPEEERTEIKERIEKAAKELKLW